MFLHEGGGTFTFGWRECVAKHDQIDGLLADAQAKFCLASHGHSVIARTYEESMPRHP
jgi:hypothetical protein